MANKKSLMMMLMMAFLSLTSISMSAKKPTGINLEAGYVDPEDEGGDFTCPSGASFETRHEGCEL